MDRDWAFIPRPTRRCSRTTSRVAQSRRSCIVVGWTISVLCLHIGLLVAVAGGARSKMETVPVFKRLLLNVADLSRKVLISSILLLSVTGDSPEINPWVGSWQHPTLEFCRYPQRYANSSGLRDRFNSLRNLTQQMSSFPRLRNAHLQSVYLTN